MYNLSSFRQSLIVFIGLLLSISIVSAKDIKDSSEKTVESSIEQKSSIKKKESITEKFIKGELDSCSGLELEIEDRYYRKGYNIGLEFRKREINSYLLSISEVLDRIFPISELYLDGTIRPALVEDVSNRIDLDSKNRLVLFQKKYRIVEPDRIEKPKSWADYLLLKESNSHLNETDLELAKGTVRVKISIEDVEECGDRLRRVAINSLKEGFNEAIDTVDKMYMLNMNKLYKDITSLLLYHDLLHRRIITPVRISAIHDDVIVDKDRREMYIDSTLYKIIEYSHFNSLPSNWR